MSWTTGKRRTVAIERDAKKALAKLYPELFGEPEDTPAANQEALRASVRSAGRGFVFALIAAAVALASSAWHPGDRSLQMVNDILRIFVWAIAGSTIFVTLLLVSSAALACIGPKRRAMIYGSALAVVLAILGYAIWLNQQ